MNELRQRLLTAPRWVIGLVTGIPFGVIMGAETGLRHGRWTDALIEGAIAGVFYGAFMALFMHRRFGRYREAMGDVPRRNVRRAAREARKGRVPEDPEARRAASRILDLPSTLAYKLLPPHRHILREEHRGQNPSGKNYL